MKTQLDMYKECQEELTKLYGGKIIALKDGEFQGEYTSKTEALKAMLKLFSPGEFIVIKCTPGDEEYTRRYRSRVILRKEMAA